MSLVAPLLGDRFDVLGRSGETAFVWQVTFEDQGSAGAFFGAAQQRPFHGSSQRWFDLGEGRLVLVAATTKQAELDLVALLGL